MNRRGFLAVLIAAPVSRALPWEGIARFIKPVMPSLASDINLSFSDLVAVTVRKHLPEIRANIMARNELLKHIQARK
jgi:hypothetical protein